MAKHAPWCMVECPGCEEEVQARLAAATERVRVLREALLFFMEIQGTEPLSKTLYTGLVNEAMQRATHALAATAAEEGGTTP